MSLYREPGRRNRRSIAVLVVPACILVFAGFGLGRMTMTEPSLASQLENVRSEAAPVADALELVAIHYGATNETTREAAKAQLSRASSSFAEVEDDLALLNPSATRAARAAIADLETLVTSNAPAANVEQAVARAEQSVRTAAGETRGQSTPHRDEARRSNARS